VTDWRARVLQALDEEREQLQDLLVELIRTPSVGGSDAENGVQVELAGWLRELGLEIDHWQLPLEELLAQPQFPGVEVDRDEAWGLVGRLPGTGGGRTLMLNGHVDVVPAGDLDTWTAGDPFSGSVRRGEVVGLGACDMKGGLVSALWAVRALARSGVPLRGDVLIAGVQGEEDGGLGTYAAIRRGWTADACVIPEPTSLDLVPANAGSLTFRLRVHGQATHASRRTVGVSAVEKFWPVLQSLSRLETARNRDVDPLFTHWRVPYALSIGTVRSGAWASSVPDLLEAEGRLGVALDEPVDQARAELEQAVADACDGDPWLREHPVEVEWWGGQFASGRLPAGSDLLDRVAAAHASVTCGGHPQTWGAPYGSDLRLLTGLAGVPTVHYGPGDAALAHGPDERVPLAEVLTCARTLAVLALQQCGPT